MMFLYVVVATALGFLIGLERQMHKHFAGVRTNALVALGSCTFVALGFDMGNEEAGRIIGQVCSGLGFLGAGVILKNGMRVFGLTTAATVWSSGAIGAVCGVGRIPDAIGITTLIIIINLMKKNESP